MNTFDDDQNADFTISLGGTPLAQAREAACFLISCILGIDPGQESSINLVMYRAMDGFCRFLPVLGCRNTASPTAEGVDLLR